jgi:hypothetical protein
MAREAALRELLSNASLADLKRLAESRDLRVSGTKSDVASRIASAVGGDAALLVSSAGPLSRDVWNDMAEKVGGARRRSFDDVAREIRDGDWDRRARRRGGPADAR